MEAFYVRKEKVHVPARPAPLIEGKLTKRGGSHGGKANWKVRYCRLIEHTFYYAESEKATACKGFIEMQGLTVREASEIETGGSEHCIHITWPETPTAVFLVQVRRAAAVCTRAWGRL